MTTYRVNVGTDGEPMDLTATQLWEYVVGSQSIGDFWGISREQGATTPSEAAKAYLDEMGDNADEMARELGVDRGDIEAAIAECIESEVPF